MALLRIVLNDFVIVQALELELNTGFSALTGETGAGKSILIDAVQFVLGARADTGTIREGAARCEVAAEFDCPVAAQAWLQDAGLETDGPLLLRRTLDAQGKSRAWINGSAATATQLRELGEYLLDIHGQHAWQSLTRAQQVRELLDAYARIDTTSLQAAWQNWRQALQALTQARQAQDQLQTEQERLNWQIAEVQKLAPAPDEWAELNAQHSRLSHAQALLDAAQQAAQLLEDDDHGNASSLLQLASAQLQDMAHIEPEFAQWAQTLDSAYAQMEDVTRSLHAYLRKTDLDPALLAQLDERLGVWMSLARRFKRPPEELAQTLLGWQQELAQLEAAADLQALAQAEQLAQQAWLELAQRISRQRQKAAPELAGKVTAAMQQLGMQGGRFEINLTPLESPASHGLEDVVFLVAGHAGSTPKPVGKVASGGELSRIALAIAVTTSELGSAGTLIFDEVDSGVGGAVAQTVGRLMQQLGRHRQVLAVTHLPQVAACANHHLRVSKRTDARCTQSTVTPLDLDERMQEIARMLGGAQSTDTSLAHAREMLAQAQGTLA
ncbi:MAG: repair protein RecN [Pseudomonadota bacterium]|jgi:DNA repair protein RecN (Recombination protein N)